MLELALDKCLVLGPDPIGIQCGLHTQLLQDIVISLQQEIPIYVPFLKDGTVLLLCLKTILATQYTCHIQMLHHCMVKGSVVSV